MYFDLYVPIEPPASGGNPQTSKKGKGKQTASAVTVTYTPTQLASIEARIDLLLHLGYTVLALTQIVLTKFDPKTHVNILNPLLPLLKKRPGVAYLKRLSIVLDEESEKGFGLTAGNAALFAPYDLIALHPTTTATFSSACLTHSMPSNLTAHIISPPLTLPRLPFRMKHTLVRTALRNGAIFEIAYAGALGDTGTSAAGGGGGERRNWWAAATEVVRVTKGKGLLVSSGASGTAAMRAPRDVGNLLTILHLPQNLAHATSTTTAKSLVVRAQTRKTYRAILSEPRVIIPPQSTSVTQQLPTPAGPSHDDAQPTAGLAMDSSALQPPQTTTVTPVSVPSSLTPSSAARKRPREGEDEDDAGRVPGERASSPKTGTATKPASVPIAAGPSSRGQADSTQSQSQGDGQRKKKKQKQGKGGGIGG